MRATQRLFSFGRGLLAACLLSMSAAALDTDWVKSLAG